MAATPNRAYRYPTVADDVRPYEDIQFLATDLDNDVQSLWLPAWVAYNSPSLVWTGSATNPVLGNGTLEGQYQLIGSKSIRFQILLTIGSTSTFGTGFWIFNMPFNATANAVKFAKGISFMDDISAQGRPGSARFSSATQVIMDNSLGAVTGTAPVVPAAGDKYSLDITYERV